MLFYNKLI